MPASDLREQPYPLTQIIPWTTVCERLTDLLTMVLLNAVLGQRSINRVNTLHAPHFRLIEISFTVYAPLMSTQQHHSPESCSKKGDLGFGAHMPFSSRPPMHPSSVLKLHSSPL